MPSNPSKLAHALARICANCPVCRQARRKQRGVAFQIVKHVETKVCPACRAYAKVTGRQAHEPVRPAHNDPLTGQNNQAGTGVGRPVRRLS